MRFLNNIVVVYAHSVSMLLVTIISVFCFGVEFSDINIAGIVLVAISILNYHGEEQPIETTTEEESMQLLAKLPPEDVDQ